ncbi:MAG: hypothetical protein HZA78_11505 [Candidatus Schekmanbacteria bacterium]|nr:hypothetical protein [Candidatus Schekmanbacteria bacterium]
MKWFKDIHKRRIRLTDERQEHFQICHPEMPGQNDNIQKTLIEPDIVVKSKTDVTIEMFYRFFNNTPVGAKYLCVIVKISGKDFFIVTAYFTDTIKRGEVLWQKT